MKKYRMKTVGVSNVKKLEVIAGGHIELFDGMGLKHENMKAR